MLIPLAIAFLLASAPTTPTPSNASSRWQNPRTTPLTLTQVKELVAISAPDAVVAGELRDRGVAFDIDEKALADLSSLGAGPKTVEILRELQARGALVVDVHREGVQVFVDAVLVGLTDKTGVLRLPLPAGEHEIVIRRPGDLKPSTLKRIVEKGRETIVDLDSELPVRVGGNIRAPRKIKDVPPVYPKEARSARAQGIVILELTIDIQGTVKEARVLRSIPLLDEAAVATAKQWLYEPTELNGRRVPVILTATVQFTWQDNPIATRGADAVLGNAPPDGRTSPAPEGLASTGAATVARANQSTMTFPVVHAHRYGRCWGTLIVSRESLRYDQSDSGKDSFDVPMSQVASVGSWSPAYLEVVLSGGRRLHFAHGVMKESPPKGFMIADLVDLKPKESIIAAIQAAK